MNFGYVYDVNLPSYTKVDHRALDTFYRAPSKSLLNLSSVVTFEWVLRLLF